MKIKQNRRTFIKQITSTGLLLCFRPVKALAQATATPEEIATPSIDYKFRSLPIEYMSKLSDDMNRLKTSGTLSNNETYRSYIDEFEINPPEKLPEAKSVILIALPDPVIHIDFNYQNTKHRVVVAPGYTRLNVRLTDLGADIRKNITGNKETKFEYAYIPAKLMAARTGLARYGKNNIAFIDGMGSYFKILTFFTDYEAKELRWQQPEVLQLCKGCDLCIKNCPTQCIREEPFVIDAGKCITLYNELADPFPEWMPAEAHNALAGCMRCQDICPANKDIPHSTEFLADVTSAETEAILSDTPDEKQLESVKTKLARVGLVADMNHLAQNLRAVLTAQARQG